MEVLSTDMIVICFCQHPEGTAYLETILNGTNDGKMQYHTSNEYLHCKPMLLLLECGSLRTNESICTADRKATGFEPTGHWAGKTHHWSYSPVITPDYKFNIIMSHLTLNLLAGKCYPFEVLIKSF